MILDRELYRNSHFVKKFVEISGIVSSVILKNINIFDKKKSLHFPKEKFIYSPRFRGMTDAVHCKSCQRVAVPVEIIIGGNTLNKVTIYECIYCHSYWHQEKEN